MARKSERRERVGEENIPDFAGVNEKDAIKAMLVRGDKPTERMYPGLTHTVEQCKTMFLDLFSFEGNIWRVCQDLGLRRETVYDWRARDPDFAARMELAKQSAVEVLEDEAKRRAYVGIEEPVYRADGMVGTVRKYSDTLLIFLLNGAAPGKYRRQEVDVRMVAKVHTTEGETLSAAEVDAVREALIQGRIGPGGGESEAS